MCLNSCTETNTDAHTSSCDEDAQPAQTYIQHLRGVHDSIRDCEAHIMLRSAVQKHILSHKADNLYSHKYKVYYCDSLTASHYMFRIAHFFCVEPPPPDSNEPDCMCSTLYFRKARINFILSGLSGSALTHLTAAKWRRREVL